MTCVAFALVISATHPVHAEDGAPVVRFILFYSPSCHHCHQISTEVLPPLLEQYGKQLQVSQVDVHTIEGSAFYKAPVEYFGILPERQGVPTVIIGHTVLAGSQEISDELSMLIKEGFNNGGLDWPAIPGLAQLANLTAESDSGSSPANLSIGTKVILFGVLGWVVLSTGYVIVRGVLTQLRQRHSRWLRRELVRKRRARTSGDEPVG